MTLSPRLERVLDLFLAGKLPGMNHARHIAVARILKNVPHGRELMHLGLQVTATRAGVPEKYDAVVTDRGLKDPAGLVDRLFQQHRLAVHNNDYGEWLAEVMDALGLERAYVVAVSWGGFVAIRLAAHAPDRITKLALLVPAGMVSGSPWAGFTKMGIPMALYLMSPSESRLRAFMKNLLTTTNDDWLPYLGDAFRSYNMNMKIPVLAKPEELSAFKAPTLVLGADLDVSFPGERLLRRAPELFPGLADKELIKDCKHCPPTTDEFRRWLSDRIARFLLANPA